MEEAITRAGSQLCEYCPLAFNNYVRWLLKSTHVEICPSAYEEEILEEPTVFDELEQSQYNKFIRDGTQTPFAPVVNFVRKEIKK